MPGSVRNETASDYEETSDNEEARDYYEACYDTSRSLRNEEGSDND